MKLLPKTFKIVGVFLFLAALVIAVIVGFYKQETWDQTAYRRQIAMVG